MRPNVRRSLAPVLGPDTNVPEVRDLGAGENGAKPVQFTEEVR